MRYITWFENISMNDVPLVGGKNASLGEMIAHLKQEGVRIPDGFAVTAKAYWYFLESNNLVEPIKKLLSQLKQDDSLSVLYNIGKEIRSLIAHGTMPVDLADEIISAYHELSQRYKQKNIDVAVRSSATAEDMPGASFAGQQETFLNVSGDADLLESCKKSFASLFTDRAIIYRQEKGFEHMKVALSIGIQKMVRSDLASAGVLFTLDTETGFKDIVMIDAAYGLGELVVKGEVNPDEFRVFKPTLEQGFASIIKKTLGDKAVKLIYAKNGQNKTIQVTTANDEYDSFCLSDDEIIELAQFAVKIEQHYSELNKRWMPMDIEWAKDGLDNKIYIVQARPETVHAEKKASNFFTQYQLKNVSKDALQEKIILTGQSIGQQIATGKARVAERIDEITAFEEGDILVTSMTDPDWVPIMKKAAAIITDRGGRTSHAAIVSRELGLPALVGTQMATARLSNQQAITVDCSQGITGYVYGGIYEIEKKAIDLETLPKVPVKIMMNIADPDQAIPLSRLPVDGVGLARIEFIIANIIKMHPMAAVEPNKITNEKIIRELNVLTCAYKSYADLFVDVLAQGIGSISAAFYPRPVIVRFSDFKSNEYRNLLAGIYYEPEEENPMLGLRGASRYYSPLYEPAFLLECKAVKKVRDDMGLSNVICMIPFVRTTTEATTVQGLMKQVGLVRGEKTLHTYMMCEVPSNIVCIDEFSALFDGISIGSNDLTQFVLAVDRDSALLSDLFNEQNLAVMRTMKDAVEGAKRNGIASGICGQAPSDYPEIARELIKAGIESISLNPDSVLPFLQQWNDKKN